MKRAVAGVALFVLSAGAVEAQDYSLWLDPSLQQPRAVPVPTLGARAGYLRQRGADQGSWFGGVQMRQPVSLTFGLELSGELHSSDFSGGDAKVQQFPVQLSGLFHLYPGAAYDLYLLLGIGWYYTRVEFSGALAGMASETDNIFGAHLGLGADIGAGTAMTIDADLRYIFLEPKAGALESERFDTIQFTIGLNFPF